jgi:hypothetical protein
MHLGIACLVGIFGRRRDNCRIDDRASGHFQSLRRQMPLHFVEQLLAQIVRFEQMTEAAHRRLVGHRLANYLANAGGVIDFHQETIDDQPAAVLASVARIGAITLLPPSPCRASGR